MNEPNKARDITRGRELTKTHSIFHLEDVIIIVEMMIIRLIQYIDIININDRDLLHSDRNRAREGEREKEKGFITIKQKGKKN